MIIVDRDIIHLIVEQDLILIRNRISELCKKLNLSLINKTKLLTASSELSRNILRYAGSGDVVIETIIRDHKKGIKVSFIDKGPGIKDLELAMQDGYSTSNNLGIGLPGSKRLSDEFFIKSEPGKGTLITIVKWKND